MFEDVAELGVGPETLARLEVFALVEPPEDPDAYDRTDEVTVTLTYGQLQMLRGALRSNAGSAIHLESTHKMLSDFTGQEYVPTCEHGNGLQKALEGILGLEDMLAEKVAEIEAESVDFIVPDEIPTDWS